MWLGKPDLEVTWELASSLPPSAIEEYEKDIQLEVQTSSDLKYGQQKSILTVATVGCEPLPKKSRKDRLVVNQNTG